MNQSSKKTSKPLKIVLIHPPLLNVIPAATPDYVDENRGHTPPLGLLYIHAAIEDSIHKSIFLDGDLHGWDHEKTAKIALSHNPDLIGIQAMSFTLPDACLLAKTIKNQSPVKIILGGPHPTIYPKETAALEYFDFAFAGEGEKNIVEFMDNFHSPQNWLKIEGLAFFNGKEFYYTPQKNYIKDIDNIPIPAREKSEYKKYSSVLATKNPITTMITSRGCPFNCIFCNRMGRSYRFHSAKYVLDEINTIAKLGIKEIFIHDDTFTLKRKRIEEICQGLIDLKLDIIWECRTRVDLVDKDLLLLMKKAGCHRISFGVESGSKKVLKAMRKEIEIDQVIIIFKLCKKLKIITLADFMFGNLDEEMIDIKKSQKLAKQLNPDYIQFSILSPYPDTPIYQIGLDRGLMKFDIWKKFANNPLMKFESPVWTENFTREELIQLTKKAYRSFYLRPKFIFKQLFRIRSLSQLMTNFKGALGMLKK